MLRGLMGDDRPLLVSMCIEHAARHHGDTEIVSRTLEGPIHRYTYADAERRARRLGKALLRLGVARGDRVATMAWNTYRHFELYHAIAGIGAVCHTLNPVLSDEQLVYIFNHAEDRLLFLETSFVPLIERLRPQLPPDMRIVLLAAAETALPVGALYEELIAAEDEDFAWPSFDERSASALCYTSGTTGKPKGVLYSHRSTMLHALGASLPGALSLNATDVVCPVVPMFHVCGWATPYTAPINGTKIVYPGAKLDGASLYELFEAEGVTIGLGVPTVWLNFNNYLRDNNKSVTTLRGIASGGTAIPRALLEAYEARGVTMLHAWGMTEMSPLGTTAALKRKHLPLDREAQTAIRLTQGRPVFGVEMKIVDAEGKEQPHDGKAVGELLVRGPWIVTEYYNDAEATAAAVEPDGWFHTGDVASIDRDGYVRLTDRRKDVIKSGGEWISSIDLENAAMAHEAVAEAAVIAIPHPKWDERPLLLVTARPGCTPTRDSLIALLAKRFPKWMLPDDVVVLDELPHTGTGKVVKVKLREMFRDHVVPQR
ncbi:MAG TPA: long-chain-fatty-acid--CoA ligase [Stellaceae bacterium]|nr:long-chain-fatty-acid--CoA ligase [Stellaceae bacterium]